MKMKILSEIRYNLWLGIRALGRQVKTTYLSSFNQSAGLLTAKHTVGNFRSVAELIDSETLNPYTGNTNSVLERLLHQG
jgi:hypothetical protein